MRIANSERQNPTLLQVNTRVYLTELSRKLKRGTTLDDIPEEEIESWANAGFDWIYMLSVWQTGEAGRQISRSNSQWRREFEETLDDLEESDIIGSGFAIKEYKVTSSIGGAEALKRLRERIAGYGMKLMLDFVPNHMAPDHPWVENHPDFFIRGTEADILRAPENFTWIDRTQGELVLAYGRDPYFSGWPDTIQLNYGNVHLQEAMKEELLQIASQCDGVRCDMAMLLLPEIFANTWSIRVEPFWPDAIQRVKKDVPGFVMMGEVYWDLEWEMQQQGFDFTYDKRLYDRLRTLEATPVRDHLRADINYQERLARFLENHDEQRVARAFPWDQHQAAAILTFLTPGLKFFHKGECQGKKVKISPHLGRGPVEKPNKITEAFYAQLLTLIKRPLFHEGEWQLLESVPAWDENQTNQDFIAFSWEYQESKVVAIVNYASCQGQALIRLPFAEIVGERVSLKEIFVDNIYHRDGTELNQRGLYVDLPGWGYHLFELRMTNRSEA
ncbi:MAG: alpha-amylase [Bacteroidales bacterium]|nr:alpha-amylase [Bacteroidales bacterium]